MSNRKILNAAATGGIGYYPVVGASDPYYDNVSLLLNGDTTVDDNFANVSLLLTGNDLLDKSNNKLTVTAYGQASVTSVKKQFGTGSYYFDGSGDYIRPAASDTCMFGTGDFTIEFWTYRISGGEFFGNGPAGGGSFGLGLGAANGDTTKLQCAIYGSPAANLSCVTNFPSNQWIHVAVTRASGTTRIFLNGVKDAETTAGGANNTTNTPSVGEVWLGSGSTLNGYIDDFRITKGVARYTTNFTPPTAALPSHEILDSSVYRLPVTAYGNARINTATKKYGTGAMYFDGNGDYLTLPASSNLDIGGGDFTIELWCWYAGTTWPSNNDLLGTGGYYTAGKNGNWAFSIRNATAIMFVIYNGQSDTTGGVYDFTVPNISVQSWHHIAVTRLNGLVNIWVDGVKSVTSLTNNTAISDGSASGLKVGGYIYPASPNYFYGYIDDIRITKGYARYTTNFTPPTTALPTTPPTILADPWWGNVSLLLDGNTTDAYDPYWQNVSLMLTGDDFIDWSNQHNAITVAGNTSINTVTKKYGTGAMYFDGSGDYLNLPITSKLLLDGDFTIEMWIQLPLSAALTYYFLLGFSSPNNYIALNKADAANYKLEYYDGGNDIYSTVTLPLNSFAHVAIVKKTNIITLYVNGVGSSSTNTGAVTWGSDSTSMYVGKSLAYPGSWELSGYIDDLRITKGIARYTANFTPPIAALPAFKIQDRTQNNLTLTPYGNVQLSTDVKKNGTGSMFFDGTGDYLSIPMSSNLQLGSGQFTVECWFYANSISGTNTALMGCYRVTSYPSNTAGWDIIYQSSTITFRWGSPAYNDIGQIATTANQWHHVAVVNAGSNIKMFLDGIQVASITTNAIVTDSAESTLWIGWAGSLSGTTINPFNGYIDDLRITKGYARYTQNFTPPSQSFATQYISTGFDPNYADVSLLLTGEGTNGSTTFTDLSSSPKTITAYGNAQISTAQKKYGTGSMYFDGSGDYATIPSTATGFSGDFTVEGWCYYSNTTGYATIFDARAAGTYSGILLYVNVGTSSINVTVGASTVIITGANPAANIWFHFALSRSGTSIYLFINGSQVGSTATNSTAFPSNTLYLGAFREPTPTLNGYIDDLRITKGIARYTTNFTPPTYALATTAGTPFDVNRSSTSLLLRGNGTNGSTSFTDESPNNLTVTTYGQTQISTSVKKYGTGAMYFDGNSDYLSVSNSANFAFGTGDFTIECWVNIALFSSNPVIIDTRATSSSSAGFALFFDTSGKLNLFLANATRILTSSAYSSNVWYHVALVQSSSIISLYVNGIVAGTYTNSYTLTDTLCAIGSLTSYDAGSVYKMNGYIDDLRITKGYARYTANFTPPTYEDPTVTGTQYDYNYAQVSLLLNGDGTNGSTSFTDLSSSPKTITTYGNAQISTGTKKFGTGSMYFDGSGDYISTPSTSNLSFGSGNFTIEVWVYASGLGSYNAVFAQWPDDGASSNNSYVMESVGSSMNFYCAASGSVISATLGTITTGSWIYYTICRSGNTLYPFKNGVLGTPVSITQTLNSPTSNVTVGGNVAGGGFWNGYIDDLRITKGIARYTTDFTPPTAPLPTSGGY